MLDFPKFIEDHAAHAEQMSALSEYVIQLARVSTEIEVETQPSFPYLIQKVQVRHFLNAINEFNLTICHSISTQSYSPAEAMTRVSIEMSVNLLFILGGDRHARSKGLLNACIDSRKLRAKKWRAFAMSEGLKRSTCAAEQLLRETESLEKTIVSSAGGPCEHWPKTSAEKFKKVGQEESYRTYFQSSSDSIHLLGEDIINQTICAFVPEEHRTTSLRLIAAEKSSFAIYLFVLSLIFQCKAISQVIERTGQYASLFDEVVHIAGQLQAIHQQHENDLRVHRDLSGS